MENCKGKVPVSHDVTSGPTDIDVSRSPGKSFDRWCSMTGLTWAPAWGGERRGPTLFTSSPDSVSRALAWADSQKPEAATRSRRMTASASHLMATGQEQGRSSGPLELIPAQAVGTVHSSNATPSVSDERRKTDQRGSFGDDETEYQVRLRERAAS